MKYFCQNCGEVEEPDRVGLGTLVCPDCGETVYEAEDDTTEEEFFNYLS